ncbi:MAG: CHASE domain-containing protein [Myxococcota bacterium]
MSGLVILVLGIAASLWIASVVRDMLAGRQRAERQVQAAQRVHTLELEIGRNVEAVRGLQGLFEASRVVTREEMHRFSLPVLDHHAALAALEWVPRVAGDQRTRLVEEARRDGWPAFRITELDEGEVQPAGVRDVYHPVLYAVPSLANRRALGLDLASDPARRAALEEARDTGRIVASESVRLVQDPEPTHGVLVVAPVYEPRVALVTREQRRRALEGFAVGVLRVEDVVGATRAGSEVWLRMTIHDVEDGEPVLLYPEKEEATALLAKPALYEQDVEVGGRTWGIRMTLPESMEEAGGTTYVVVFIVGVLLTILLSAYVQLVVGRTETVRRLVRDRTAQLQEANRRLAREVRERSRAEAALRASETRLAILLEHVPGAIWTAESDLRIRSAAGARLVAACGADAEDLVGSSVESLPGDPEEVVGSHRQALAGEPANYEYEVDGHVWEVRVERVQEAGAQQVVAVALDVTERRRLQAARLEARLQRSQKLESLGLLAGGVAHDFNNLLVGILGNASLLLDEIPEDAPWRSRLAQIEVAAQRASELTRQMLAYSGRGRLVMEPLRLPDLVEEMSELLEASLPKKIVLRFDFAPETPLVEADPTQLRQLVMNLITNAGDAIGEGGGRITIRTRAVDADRESLDATQLGGELEEGRYALLEVCDTGEGMDEETRRRMFDPFYTTKEEGHGLGLAAILGIVRGHGGTLDVESAPGEGTAVRVLLPGIEREVPGEEEAAEPEVEGDLEGTVLVADDEDLVRTLAEAVLTGAGLEVVTAADGDEAVERFRERADAVDVVLLDLTMPKRDGVEVLRMLRGIRPDVPVVVSSGYSRQEVMATFQEERPDGFIQKPFRAERLLRVVREVLGRDTGDAQVRR